MSTVIEPKSLLNKIISQKIQNDQSQIDESQLSFI